MELAGLRELFAEIQSGARITTAVGEPIPVGDRVMVPVAEISYGGGGGGGGGQAQSEAAQGSGGGGGGGIHIRPLGCWVIGPNDEHWLPAIDVNRLILVWGTIAMVSLLTIRTLFRHR